jgi:hypothetical protein
VGNRDLWLRNEGGKGFTEVAQSLGTEDWQSKVYGLTCFDADRNGWPDILTLQASQHAIGVGQLHHLWMNYGEKFTEEANKRGLVMPADQAKRPYAIDCVDFNGSGWPSCIGTGNNYTYWLLNTDGRFRALTGAYEPIADLSPYLHDAAWADFNGDGRLDVAIVDTFDARGNSVLKVHCNNGSRATDVGHADGLRNCWNAPITHQVNFTGDPRSLAVGDFDNDGSADMFLTHEGGLVIKGRSAKGPDYLFMNSGSATFTEVGAAAGVAGPVGTREGGGGAAVIDYDRDGRLDLVVGYNALYSPGPFRLYRNVTANGNSWIGFVLRGPQILGASVEAQACGRTWRQDVTARTGWLAQDSRNIHVGLGRCAGPVSVVVHWPGGPQTTASVAAGSYYLLSSAGGAPAPLPPANGAR